MYNQNTYNHSIWGGIEFLGFFFSEPQTNQRCVYNFFKKAFLLSQRKFDMRKGFCHAWKMEEISNIIQMLI